MRHRANVETVRRQARGQTRQDLCLWKGCNSSRQRGACTGFARCDRGFTTGGVPVKRERHVGAKPLSAACSWVNAVPSGATTWSILAHERHDVKFPSTARRDRRRTALRAWYKPELSPLRVDVRLRRVDVPRALCMQPDRHLAAWKHASRKPTTPLHIDHGKHQSDSETRSDGRLFGLAHETNLLSDVRRDACLRDDARGDPKTAARIRCETRAASSRSTCVRRSSGKTTLVEFEPAFSTPTGCAASLEGETHLGCRRGMSRTKGSSRTTTRQVRSRGRQRSADPLPRFASSCGERVSSIVMPDVRRSIVTGFDKR